MEATSLKSLAQAMQLSSQARATQASSLAQAMQVSSLARAMQALSLAQAMQASSLARAMQASSLARAMLVSSLAQAMQARNLLLRRIPRTVKSNLPTANVDELPAMAMPTIEKKLCMSDEPFFILCLL